MSSNFYNFKKPTRQKSKKYLSINSKNKKKSPLDKNKENTKKNDLLHNLDMDKHFNRYQINSRNFKFSANGQRNSNFVNPSAMNKENSKGQ